MPHPSVTLDNSLNSPACAVFTAPTCQPALTAAPMSAAWELCVGKLFLTL